MLKFIITVAVIGGLAYGGWELYLQTKERTKPANTEAPAPAPAAETKSLPGMPPSLEPIYEASKQKGMLGLKGFLARYGKTIQDPRLASIELDYVVLVTQKDIAEARKVFRRVKDRTPPSSPVYERVKQLENTYE